MKKNTLFEFLEKSSNVHNNMFDYSLVEYKNSRTKVKIICPKHGIFEQLPYDHMRGIGCLKCKYENHFKVSGIGTIKFIEKSKQIHDNKYDYSKVDYKSNRSKVCIICEKHGEFWQIPSGHLNGKGCFICAKEKDKERLKKINDKRHLDNVINFINKAKKVHGEDTFTYLENYESCFKKVEIQCNTCNRIFTQTPANHLNGTGCPYCRMSKGEKKIVQILKNVGINFEVQKSFEQCRGKKRPLLFDFYLPNYNTCIEFDGEQHFHPVNFRGGLNEKEMIDNFENVRNSDEIKNKYCSNSGMRLFRISYKDDIEEKMYEIV